MTSGVPRVGEEIKKESVQRSGEVNDVLLDVHSPRVLQFKDASSILRLGP